MFHVTTHSNINHIMRNKIKMVSNALVLKILITQTTYKSQQMKVLDKTKEIFNKIA